MKQNNMSIRLAQIHEVHKNSFLCAFTKDLWGPHNCSPPISSKLWIILPKNVKHPTKKLHSTKRVNILQGLHHGTNTT